MRVVAQPSTDVAPRFGVRAESPGASTLLEFARHGPAQATEHQQGHTGTLPGGSRCDSVVEQMTGSSAGRSGAPPGTSIDPESIAMGLCGARSPCSELDQAVRWHIAKVGSRRLAYGRARSPVRLRQSQTHQNASRTLVRAIRSLRRKRAGLDQLRDHADRRPFVSEPRGRTGREDAAGLRASSTDFRPDSRAYAAAPGRRPAPSRPGARCLHGCSSVQKRYQDSRWLRWVSR